MPFACTDMHFVCGVFNGDAPSVVLDYCRRFLKGRPFLRLEVCSVLEQLQERATFLKKKKNSMV
jgi:hypothetical protein